LEETNVKTTVETPNPAIQRSAALSADSTVSSFSVNELHEAWGLAGSFDIYNCDPATIRDAGKIKEFVAELCDLIEMKRFGDTMVVDFGDDERVAGYSMVQLIETSLISAHFANKTNATYLDVFSCKPYNPNIVADFAKRFFGGSECIAQVNLRR
jgi:S-adenosylmethionine/arginine decarboxylase-like enzyme